MSGYLEPTLLDQAEHILGTIPGIVIARNVTWHSGEIDLLAYDPMANVALQIQAKSPLPPQGYRMTRRIETHTLKAVKQLGVFESESAQLKDQICSRAIGRKVSGVMWDSAVLSRSGFGTWCGWSAIEPYIPINITLLREVIKRLQMRPEGALGEIRTIAQELLEEIIGRTVRSWKIGRIELFKTSLEIPLLDMDNDEMQKVIGEMSP